MRCTSLHRQHRLVIICYSNVLYSYLLHEDADIFVEMLYKNSSCHLSDYERLYWMRFIGVVLDITSFNIILYISFGVADC